MTESHKHTSHTDILNRLKRAQGHLSKVISMIENEENCLKLAQQLQAVESAISKAKHSLIHDHIDHCLEHAADASASGQRASLDEFRQIAKYL